MKSIITGYTKRVDFKGEFSITPRLIEKDEFLLAKAMYAVFTVNGNNANGEIGKAFQWIYSVWLPNSVYCLYENLLVDFEYYDERWDCQAASAQMDLYIPVRKLED